MQSCNHEVEMHRIPVNLLIYRALSSTFPTCVSSDRARAYNDGGEYRDSRLPRFILWSGPPGRGAPWGQGADPLSQPSYSGHASVTRALARLERVSLASLRDCHGAGPQSLIGPSTSRRLGGRKPHDSTSRRTSREYKLLSTAIPGRGPQQVPKVL